MQIHWWLCFESTKACCSLPRCHSWGDIDAAQRHNLCSRSNYFPTAVITFQPWNEIQCFKRRELWTISKAWILIRCGVMKGIGHRISWHEVNIQSRMPAAYLHMIETIWRIDLSGIGNSYEAHLNRSGYIMWSPHASPHWLAGGRLDRLAASGWGMSHFQCIHTLIKCRPWCGPRLEGHNS